MVVIATKFSLGLVVVTPGALEVFERPGADQSIVDLMSRHASGDWGEICDEDKALNDQAVLDGDRVLSAYSVGTERIWVITEWDRSVSTLLRPDEY